MKKVYYLIIIGIMMFNINVYASGVSFDFEENNGKIKLIVKDDDNNSISYKDAIKKYNIDEYIKLPYKDTEKYFYLGKEISSKEYKQQSCIEDAKKRAKSYDKYGIYVTNTDDVIKYIKKIYGAKLFGDYHLTYCKSNDIDLDYIEKYIKDNYISDIDKNIYTYLEYTPIHPMKFMPNYDDEEMVISSFYVKTTEDEQNRVEEFKEQFVRSFKNKSDYEKIVGVYKYLSNTVNFLSEEEPSNFLEGHSSTYDTLIERKSGCLGLSLTFSYLMDSLGIKSYIVDHVKVKDEDNKSYGTDHSYNIVKLDNNWYIVDIGKDENTLLVGKDSKLYNEDDLKYLDINISDKSYNKTGSNIDIDYKYYDNLVDLVKKHEDGIKKKDEIVNNNDTLYYIVLSLVLLVIALIIALSTKKKK